MPLKLNISNKDKAWKLEVEVSTLEGKSIGDIVEGKTISPDLEGYELRITGGSDLAGLPMSEKVEGIGMKRVLLTKGWGFHKRPKGVRKYRDTPKGMRKRKTVRGKTISEKTVQVNLSITKEGNKKLVEIFPEQNKAPESPEGKTDSNTNHPTQEEQKQAKSGAPQEKQEEPKQEVAVPAA